MSTTEGTICLLQPLGLLSIRGPDALRFLQGQLSNDVAGLEATAGRQGGTLLRAGLHSPQGRALALLGLVAPDPTSVLAVLPRELVQPTLATLRRYVLRAKVVLADDSDAYRLMGLAPGAPSPRIGTCVHYDGTRRLLIQSAAEARDAAPTAGIPEHDLPFAAWHAQDIAAGLPQVYTATSGLFVAQMLNLDCIGAVSFTKGCYTGQEVIARAHYRGRVKRRMQRYISHDPLALRPGEVVELADGTRLRVVDAAQLANGHCDFLAIPTHSDVSAAPGAPGAGSAGGEAPAPAAHVEAQLASLPYSLPA